MLYYIADFGVVDAVSSFTNGQIIVELTLLKPLI